MQGIIGALDEEVTLLTQAMGLTQKHQKARMPFWSGTVGGIPVVVAKSGIGKVNAAVCTQILIGDFHVDSVIFTGVAGALLPSLRIGDIVVANGTVQHDFDLTVFGRRPGEIPAPTGHLGLDETLVNRLRAYYHKDRSKLWGSVRIIEANEGLVRLACEAFDEVRLNLPDPPDLVVGTIASGDRFISGGEGLLIQRSFGAICAEMEGAATGYVCYLNEIPFVIIRSISDQTDGTRPEDFLKFSEKSAAISARVVLEMLRRMTETS